MKLKRRQCGFQLKEISDEGEFSGYGSVFDTVDWYRDVVKKGAFLDSLDNWKQQDRLPPVLWQHDSRQPIGPHTLMREDPKGLYVEGLMLINDVQKAREAHALTKSKAINGMSIGYDVPEGGSEYDGKTNVNNLTKIDLWEVSICTFPANTDARVENVKHLLSAGQLPTLREFEDLLREVGGFSNAQAKTIAGHGLKRLLDERDARDGVIDEKSIDDIAALFADTNILRV